MISGKTSLCTVLAVACVSGTAFGQGLAALVGDAKNNVAGASIRLAAALADAEAKVEANKKFLGADMGLGVALTITKEPRVSDAELVGGLVRVKKDEQYVPRVVWESHYFLPLGPVAETESLALDGTVVTRTLHRYGTGPFVSLQSSGEEVIDAVGLGWMVGMRKSLSQPDSINIGIGYLWEKSVKDLGDGIKPNKPLPAGEADVRYREGSAGALTLVLSFSF